MFYFIPKTWCHCHSWLAGLLSKRNSFGVFRNTHFILSKLMNVYYLRWERSGSMIECLTRNREAAGSSHFVVTALCPWERHINPNLVLVQPIKTRPNKTERLLIGRKNQNKQILFPTLKEFIFFMCFSSLYRCPFLYTGKTWTGTLANSEDPDVMQQHDALHQGLNCFYDQNNLQGQKYTIIYKISNYDPLTHYIGLASFLRDIGKQCRPSSDDAERVVWSGSSLFANRMFY